MKERTQTKAQYTGGDLRLEGPSPFCHVAIGLESVPWGKTELAAVTVLQSILGGGSAVTNAPGSGLTSRLATQVVQQSPYVESCAAFNTSYSDSGLFGVYGVSHPDKAGDMVTGMLKALSGLTAISKDELAGAKAVLKTKMLRQVDDDATMLKDIGQQMLLSDGYGSPAAFCEIIDSTTMEQVTGAAKTLLSSRPTLAAYGDTHAVPHYGAVEAGLAA